MFREMRRKKQQLTEIECIEILTRNTSGVLAVSGDNDYPYAVPLSYVLIPIRYISIVPKVVTNWMPSKKIVKRLFA